MGENLKLKPFENHDCQPGGEGVGGPVAMGWEMIQTSNDGIQKRKELKMRETLFKYLPTFERDVSMYACCTNARTRTDGTFRTTAEKVSFHSFSNCYEAKVHALQQSVCPFGEFAASPKSG